MISPNNAQDHRLTLIANLARLGQTSSPASKFAACDFSAPEGGSDLPFRTSRLWAIESAQCGAVGSLTGGVVVETANQRAAKDDAYRG